MCTRHSIRLTIPKSRSAPQAKYTDHINVSYQLLPMLERGHLTQHQTLLTNSTQIYQEHAPGSSTEKRIFLPAMSTLEVTLQNPGKIILSKGESSQICNKKLLFWFQLNLNSTVEKQFSFHFSLSLLFIWWLIFAVSNYRNLQPC